MAENNVGDRQMFKGNWKCSSCSTDITQLPFQPDPSREGSLLCRDCHQAQRNDRPKRERQMFEGNWKCSSCSTDITQLPFQPDPTRENELMCRDCYRK